VLCTSADYQNPWEAFTKASTSFQQHFCQ